MIFKENSLVSLKAKLAFLNAINNRKIIQSGAFFLITILIEIFLDSKLKNLFRIKLKVP